MRYTKVVMNIREPHQYIKVRTQRQRTTARRHLRGWLLRIIVLLLCVALVAYGLVARPLPNVAGQPAQAEVAAQTVALAWPSVGQAAIGVDGQGVIASTGSTKSMPTASVAKIMLAYNVLKKYPLQPGQTGPAITVTQVDVDSYNNSVAEDGSVVPVQLGEQLTEYQALQALLLPSANNIAEMLARWAFGSVEAYTQAAAQTTQDLNMLNSHFADASGFAPETVSTPRDLILLAQAALQNPVIKSIVAQPTANLPLVGTVWNTNILLGKDNIIGIKTGNTDQAGGCYLFAANHQMPNGRTITVIGVVMGAPSLYRAMAASRTLLASFLQGFGSITAIHKGQTLANYRAPWGATTRAVAASDLSVYGWLGQAPKVTVRPAPVTANSQAGAKAGSVEVDTPYGRASGSLELSKSLSPPSAYWRLLRR